ncbi:hypothetical protein O1L44_01930 [Streptomyces noursei]|nr:hypothetical protein [Streptomyces noursei]
MLAGLRQREELSEDFLTAIRGLDPRGGRPERDAAALRPFLELAPRHHAVRVRALRLLSVTLQMSYRATGDARTLAEAVRLGRELLLLIPAGGACWADAVAQHARVVGDHYRHTGDRRDIDEAVDCGREALRHTPPDSERLAPRLDDFGMHLALRYDVSGAPSDLNAAIDASRGAVRAVPGGTPDAVSHRARLAGLLVKRHRVSGDGAALDEAVQLVRGEPQPLPAPGRDGVCVAHAEVLHAQYRRTGLVDVLDDAIELYRQAADERRARRGNPPTSRSPSATWATRSTTCAPTPRRGPPRSRRAAAPEPPALREAIAAHREAVEVSAADDPQRPGHLDNLARSLRERARRKGARTPSTRRSACCARPSRPPTPTVSSARACSPTLRGPVGTPTAHRGRRAGTQAPPGGVRLRRGNRPERRRPARRADPPAPCAGGAGDRHRPPPGGRRGLCTRRRPAAANGAPPTARQRTGVPTGPARPGPGGRRRGRGPPGGRPRRPARALELLEQGRGILLTRALGLHGEEEALRDAAPQLADRLAKLRTALTTAPAAAHAEPGDLRRQLAEQWDALVAEARRLPGLADFLSRRGWPRCARRPPVARW